MSVGPAQPFLRRTELVLRIALGIVFIVAGFGKIFIIDQFAGTISGVTHLPPDTSTGLAAALVAIEILGGIALIARVMVVPVAMLFCLLLAVFLWVLASAVIQGREIQCHCFGLLNIALSNRVEILLDIILFNLFILLGIISTLKGRRLAKGRSWALAGSVAVLFYFQYSAFAWMVSDDRSGRTVDIQPMMSHFENRDLEFSRYTLGNRVLFLLHFPDFNCPPCFDSFVTVSQMVRMQFLKEEATRTLAVFKPGDIADPHDTSLLTRWAEANELGFPVLIAPDSVFQRLKFQKSSLLVLSPSGRVLFSETLPIGHQKIEYLKRLLQERYGSRP